VKIEISAPGKLILFGEYAVLFGAPALVMAIDRRSRVNLSLSEGVRWRVFAPGLAPEPAELEIDAAGRHRWYGNDEVVAELGLVDRLLRELAAMELIDIKGAPAADVVLDTTEFYRTRCGRRCKLGLGSSAALTVAAAAALGAWAGTPLSHPPDPVWLQALVDVHRGIQGGKGSGIDVAASAIGRVLTFRLEGDGAVAAATPTTLPEGLIPVCIWTGKSASTGDFLERLESRRRTRPREVGKALERLCDVSESGAGALSEGRTERFLTSVGEFWEALDDLGEAIEMPILSNEHRHLRQLGNESGVQYKPSGAGGGDFGIALTDSEAAAEEIAVRAAAAGFEVVDLRIEPEGVRES
jgi:phosphomevalonate kinase